VSAGNALFCRDDRELWRPPPDYLKIQWLGEHLLSEQYASFPTAVCDVPSCTTMRRPDGSLWVVKLEMPMRDA
jgi:hypothetical protein